MAETISNLIPRAKDLSAVANVIAINADGPGYYDAQAIMVKVANTNSGAVTLSISGRSAVPVRKRNNVTLAAGDIEAGQWCLFIYNGDDNVFEMLSQVSLVSGSGDVVGPGSSTDNAISRFDGTTGKIIQNSGTTIDDDNNIFANNFFASLTSVVSAGGTTVLTVASARVQRLTGSSSQTFQLPDATTLPLTSIFEFDNNSSSSLIISNNG